MERPNKRRAGRASYIQRTLFGWYVTSESPRAAALMLAIAALGLLTAVGVGQAKISHAGREGKPLTPDPCSFTTLPSLNLGPDHEFFNVATIAPNNVWAVGYVYNTNNNPHITQTLIEHWNGSEWSVVTSPNPSTIDNYLEGVAAVSANDVWAVGNYGNSTYQQTLIEHWDGAIWSVVSSPNVGPTDHHLYNVTARSTDDVWAVGSYFNTGIASMDETLVEHWDGSAWTIVSSPNPGDDGGFLYGVDAITAGDVWAVGDYLTATGNIRESLVEHWNGAAWSVIPSPNAGSDYDSLASVAAIGANDAWAIGTYRNGGGHSYTLAEHWNGSAWSVVATPDPGSQFNILSGVSAMSAGDVWAVGYYYGGTAPYTALTEHWNGSAWSVISNPDPGSGDNYLFGVSTIGPGDVWSVGTVHRVGAGDATLAKHWNGSAWSVVAVPDAGAVSNELVGVAAIAANNVWAVGDGTNPISNTAQSLIQHWDGAAWNIVASPNPGGSSSGLQDITAVAAGDIWAVGSYINAGTRQTLIEHWNGTVWSILPSPSPGTFDNNLSAVAAIGTNDVWAVGFFSNGANVAYTLTEHWNGTIWSVVASPNPSFTYVVLKDVTAVASDDVWAVGSATNTPVTHSLAMHWDGALWSLALVPTPSTSADELLGISVISANDVWAVGSYLGSSPVLQTLVEHWNGSAWSIVSSPNAGSGHNFLYDIAGLTSNDIWAVGTFQDGIQLHSLAEHWNGSLWSLATSSNVGSGQNGLTGVSPVGAGDVWAVGSYIVPNGASQTLSEHYTCAACTLHFEDVPQGSTYYSYVRCMACRGIINGYACGGVGEPCNSNNDPYFRPNRNITRGQIAKIVALASGNHSPVSGQTFEDVTPASTFYTYTEQLYLLGVMSGYPCGGVGEPCVPPANRPYFRPNNNATRGQISKIDANTAGFSDPPSGQQFEDVAVGSAFYTYTYRLVSRGIMSGYGCGGAGELCIPPGNLPYFRPNANATRGQTSKIVANTFFPDCQTPARK